MRNERVKSAATAASGASISRRAKGNNMRIPVLLYHSMNISGNDYPSNDHVALHSDLRYVTARGYRILPLHQIVAAWLESPQRLEGERIVALTCDDGPDFDFRDLEHPTAGSQRSFLNILRDFRAEFPSAQPGLFMTSFVIAAPVARTILDRACMVGKGWMNDDWWTAAVDSGLMGIANHSWDHNHEALRDGKFPDLRRGTFASIDTRVLADHQIAKAGDLLRRLAPNPDASLFAYPFGRANRFLRRTYFPAHAERLGIVAAFTDAAQPLTPRADRWAMPRFTCGRDWRSEEGLKVILDDCQRRPHVWMGLEFGAAR